MPDDAASTKPALSDPPTYLCRRASRSPRLQDPADPVWQRVDWTDDFVDIEGPAKPTPRLRTRAKMLWDDDALYVLAEMQEPHVWATLTKRNSIIYRDNDIELFLDPAGTGRDYYELELNARGTRMELVLDKPYHEGGDYQFLELDAVQTAVHVRGTLNDPADEDDGWSAIMAVPFKALATVTGEKNVPPVAGDAWRVNLSRVQWRHRVEQGRYVKVPKEESPEDNWVWSPTGVIDMHRPERWGTVMFAADDEPE